MDTVPPVRLLVRGLCNVVRDGEVESGRDMRATFGADILGILIRVTVKEQSTALYTVPPVRLLVRGLCNVVLDGEVESGRDMRATFGADILEILVRVTVKEQSTALYAVPPVRLLVGGLCNI